MTNSRLSGSVYLPAVLFAASLAVLGTVAVLTAPAAHAFTFQDQEPGAGSGKADDNSMFYNSGAGDRQTSRFDDGSKKTIIQNGNSSLYIGGSGQSYGHSNGPDNYFSPNYLMGR
ncbi:MAG: hypothetical protein GC182_03755 [Rhodopseudomonas sp.]|nr:hypothetical protein [Rhodopseudomonas sp.]